MPISLISRQYRVLLTLGWLGCGIAAASLRGQTTIYDNLADAASTTVQNWSGRTKVAQSFTSSVSGDFASITLNLGTTNNSGTPVLSVQLWSDNNEVSPLPFTLLATFVSGYNWNNLYAATIDPDQTVTFTTDDFVENYTVAAGTTYWLVVASTSGSAKYWGLSSVGNTASASYSSDWTTLSSSGGLGARLALTAVPEPATNGVIAGVCLLGFAGYRRRR